MTIPYGVFTFILKYLLKNKTYHKPYKLLLEDVNTISKPIKIKSDLNEVKYFKNDKKLLLHHFNKNGDKTILYLPGGSFSSPPNFFHVSFVKKMAKMYNYHMILVQYPLYPECDPKESSELIKNLLIELNNKNMILMGDSAGACLALLSLHRLHIESIDIVSKLVLISPWVDGKMDNKSINKIQPYDYLLNKENCKRIAEVVFFKSMHTSYLCPSKTAFKYKSQIFVLSGEHEIFTPDTKLWAKSQNILKVKYKCYEKMCHSFIILPIKKSYEAMDDIYKFINNIN